jgi:hypothetical protein
MQIGIIKAVSWINTRAKPSKPKTKCILIELSQSFAPKNWKPVAFTSKKNNSIIVKLKIKSDQNNEKLRITWKLALSIKLIITQAAKGKKIRVNNIKN